MATSKDNLKVVIERGIKYKKYLLIQVSINGAIEFIINKPENLEKKLEYYINAYNDNLELINNKNIKIKYFEVQEKEILLDTLEVLLD
jgi:hypothetical protein